MNIPTELHQGSVFSIISKILHNSCLKSSIILISQFITNIIRDVFKISLKTHLEILHIIIIHKENYLYNNFN